MGKQAKQKTVAQKVYVSRKAALVIFGLPVVAVSIYISTQLRRNQPDNLQPSGISQSEKSVTQETAGSKTYSNSEYEVSFSFPAEYQVEYETTTNDGSYYYEIRSPLDPNYSAEMRGTGGMGKNELAIMFTFTRNSQSVDIEEYLTEVKGKIVSDRYSKIIKTESITVDNRKIYILTVQRMQSPIKKVAILLSKKTKLEVRMEPAGSSRESEFASTLSSVRFSD